MMTPEEFEEILTNLAAGFYTDAETLRRFVAEAVRLQADNTQRQAELEQDLALIESLSTQVGDLTSALGQAQNELAELRTSLAGPRRGTSLAGPRRGTSLAGPRRGTSLAGPRRGTTIVKFTYQGDYLNGYDCDQSGNMTGEYVPLAEYRMLESEVERLTAALRQAQLVQMRKGLANFGEELGGE